MNDTTQTGASEDTLRKIRKLLARGADERGNENEREMAMRQAHKMLVEHNLSMADVGSTSPQEKREERKSSMSVYPWARGIAHSLAQLFFCAYYFQRGAGKKATHAFIGKASNAVTAQEMAEYIISNVFKELRTRYGSETSPEARAFAVGCEDALRRRCRELREQADREAKGVSSGRALVLASLYQTEATENAQWIKDNVGKLVTQKDRTKAAGGAAYSAGRDHGNSINLSRQVGTSTGKGALRIK